MTTTLDARATATEFHTPLGTMFAVADAAGLVALDFIDGRKEQVARGRWADATLDAGGASDPVLRQLAGELDEYFAGRRQAFDVPLAVRTGGAFEAGAWAYLRTIPFGQTHTYGQQARGMGKPLAVRAVGRANGRNPIAVIVPCHRVIGADGTLTGYAGGLERKRWLLDHERRIVRGDLAPVPRYYTGLSAGSAAPTLWAV